MDDNQALLRSRIFDGLPEGDRRHWLRAATPRALKRGHTLARQGEPATALYLVASGLLRLLQLTPDGRELIVRFVSPGEPFGGVVVIEGGQYPVTAVAVESAEVRVWPRQTLSTLLATFPLVGNNLMREMATHMNDALTRVRELTTLRVGPRLAHTLLRLMRQCGQPAPQGVLIAHPLTRQELADLVGATLYTVSRTLAEWQSAGILRSTRRDLLILEPKRLDAIARAAG